MCKPGDVGLSMGPTVGSLIICSTQCPKEHYAQLKFKSASITNF